MKICQSLLPEGSEIELAGTGWHTMKHRLFRIEMLLCNIKLDIALKNEIFYSFFSTPQLVECLLTAEKKEVLELTK